ncbi:DUF5133 domain-containing protein [Streptomyces capillispiralis]|uniref:Uncharacterized protein DUF5133 n=1 Tax=Streptomyces capillispiralis TaxID=68182 RepID=A0A561TR08_9ACTN|nr:DUF5133 domain-containing protein [Streptomyces capillispiralis]TWF89546.1 uncharacterized protein DUF5133 [Streptomyces capillispiralis]GHH93477.1 DUF5133 domain-containing protein [Streptomyces capillispiralis]
MLKPHPTVLRRLVDEYEALAAAGTGTAGKPAARDARIRDLAYTLCVSTGTRDVRHALATAHRWLAGSETATVPAPPAGPDAVLPVTGTDRWDTTASAPAPA